MKSAQRIAVLGSTGSVGTSSLEVVRQYSDRLNIVGLAAGSNVQKLIDQIREFKPLIASVTSESDASLVRTGLGPTCPTQIVWGAEGLDAVAGHPDTDTVISAIVGAAGLKPTLAAARAGRKIALANKESLVVAGALVRTAVEEYGATLLPVDSEHSALFQALSGSPIHRVRRLILTASGGPFFQQPELDLSTVSPAQALKHPNWSMGDKITIDSATMMNKGLELIEARWLFNVGEEQLDVVVHPQSIVHSMVEYVDGSVMAQLSVPDMKGPIAYALSYPDRLEKIMKPLDFTELRELTFFKPDHDRFPAVKLALSALRQGNTYPAVLNGANEVTVAAFLAGEIGFKDIVRLNQKVLYDYQEVSADHLEDFIAADRWGREHAKEYIGRGMPS